MTTSDDDLEAQIRTEYQRLDAAATPGPWTTGKLGIMHPAWVCYSDKEKAKIEHAGHTGALIWAADDDEQKEDARDVHFRGGPADEALVAFLRNNFGDTLRRLDDARAEIAQYKDMIDRMSALFGQKDLEIARLRAPPPADAMEAARNLAGTFDSAIAPACVERIARVLTAARADERGKVIEEAARFACEYYERWQNTDSPCRGDVLRACSAIESGILSLTNSGQRPDPIKPAKER